MKVRNEPGACGFLAGLVVLFLGLLANASCARAAKPAAYTESLKASYDAAVEITAHCIEPDGTTTGWMGSGVIVNETRLLTAGHVASTDPGEICSFVAEEADGTVHLVYPSVVLAPSAFDLASMELVSFTEKFHAQPVRFGPVPVLGEIVCSATAHPRREHHCGQVMKGKAPPGDIRIDMVVEPGNSGSALYNMKHELVGIVVHTYPNRGNGQYVTGGASSLAGHVQELLK